VQDYPTSDDQQMQEDMIAAWGLPESFWQDREAALERERQVVANSVAPF
jgi:hypothetical protein